MRWDWRNSILYLCLLGMEACCLYLLLVLLNIKTVSSVLSVAGLLLLYPVAFAINKGLQYLRWHRFWLSCISWLLWAIATLLLIKFQLFMDTAFLNPDWLLAFPRALGQLLVAFRPEMLIFLTGILLWWLGRRMASVQTTFTTAIAEFQMGLIILVIIFFSASMLYTELPGAIAAVLIFFFLALCAVSLANAQEGKHWFSGLTQGHWSAILLASIGVVLLLGLAIAFMVTPDLLHIIIAALGRVWDILWGLIMKLLLFLASLFPTSDPSQFPREPVMPAPPPEEGNIFQIPEWLRESLRLVWSVLMGGLILFALWSISMQLINFLRRRLTGMQGVEVKGIRGGLRADLLGLIRYIWQALYNLMLRLRSKKKPVMVVSEAAFVRQTYRRLLRWAARQGCARQSTQTPQEFFDMLAGVLPDFRTELAYITQHYMNVRYGDIVPAKDERDRLNLSWLRIKKSRLRLPEKRD